MAGEQSGGKGMKVDVLKINQEQREKEEQKKREKIIMPIDETINELKNMRGKFIALVNSLEGEYPPDYEGLCGQFQVITDVIEDLKKSLNRVLRSLEEEEKLKSKDANESPGEGLFRPIEK